MDTAEYNGWTNRATRLVKQHIDNDQAYHRHWIEKAREAKRTVTLADQLKYWVEEIMDSSRPQSLLAGDLMGYATDQVNYREIAETLIEESEELC